MKSEPGFIFFGNEPGRILGPREQKIYDHYCVWLASFDCPPATAEKWRMESQRIPNV